MNIWVDDLSDDELLARLEQAGVNGGFAELLVSTRDTDAAHHYITDVLEASE